MAWRHGDAASSHQQQRAREGKGEGEHWASSRCCHDEMQIQLVSYPDVDFPKRGFGRQLPSPRFVTNVWRTKHGDYRVL